jgi:hypothetical protein
LGVCLQRRTKYRAHVTARSSRSARFPFIASIAPVANLIVAQRAKARGVEIGFWAYFRVGAPLSLMTIVIGLLLL